MTPATCFAARPTAAWPSLATCFPCSVAADKNKLENSTSPYLYFTTSCILRTTTFEAPVSTTCFNGDGLCVKKHWHRTPFPKHKLTEQVRLVRGENGVYATHEGNRNKRRPDEHAQGDGALIRRGHTATM